MIKLDIKEAENLVSLGLLDEAMEVLNGILKIDAWNIKSLFLKRSILETMGGDKSAIRYLNEKIDILELENLGDYDPGNEYIEEEERKDQIRHKEKIEEGLIEDNSYVDRDDSNIAEIVLSCINSEAYLHGVEKGFVITDISKENIELVFKAANYKIETLLKLEKYLDLFRYEDWSRRDEDERLGEEAREEKERLDSEWIAENRPGDDACENCGYSLGRNHDCNDAVCGDFCEEKEPKISLTVGDIVSELVGRIVFMTTVKPNLDSENENWIKSVNDNLDNFTIIWIEAIKRGELTSEDVLRVIEKIAKLRGDEGLVSYIEYRISALPLDFAKRKLCR